MIGRFQRFSVSSFTVSIVASALLLSGVSIAQIASPDESEAITKTALEGSYCRLLA